MLKISPKPYRRRYFLGNTIMTIIFIKLFLSYRLAENSDLFKSNNSSKLTQQKGWILYKSDFTK